MQTANKKKVVLITGGSRGIGKALVEKFKQNGWTVATCATRESHLKESRADLTFQCDVAKPDQVKKGVNLVLQKLGQIDALINNAGTAGTNPLDPESSDEIWTRIIDVNLNGTYYFCKQTMPHLPDGSGRIVNIASILALKGVPDGSAYCAAKHGVLGLTRSLAHYLAPRKITVNAVCPGWVQTDMAAERMSEIGITEKDLQRSVPLGRFIQPSEIADFTYSLVASEGTSMMTGQALSIDGGSSP